MPKFDNTCLFKCASGPEHSPCTQTRRTFLQRISPSQSSWTLPFRGSSPLQTIEKAGFYGTPARSDPLRRMPGFLCRDWY